MTQLERIFRALSDETRLRVMGLVFRHGHLCVCEVERVLGVTQSKASRHLRYLRDAGLLEDERDGVIVNYRLPHAPSGDVPRILAVLDEILAERTLPDAAPVLVQLRAARSTEGAQT